jgi:hypothetical protein
MYFDIYFTQIHTNTMLFLSYKKQHCNIRCPADAGVVALDHLVVQHPVRQLRDQGARGPVARLQHSLHRPLPEEAAGIDFTKLHFGKNLFG